MCCLAGGFFFSEVFFTPSLHRQGSCCWIPNPFSRFYDLTKCHRCLLVWSNWFVVFINLLVPPSCGPVPRDSDGVYRSGAAYVSSNTSAAAAIGHSIRQAPPPPPKRGRTGARPPIPYSAPSPSPKKSLTTRANSIKVAPTSAIMPS